MVSNDVPVVVSTSPSKVPVIVLHRIILKLQARVMPQGALIKKQLDG